MAPNAKIPFPATGKLVVPLSLSVRPEPLWPLTVPPTVKLFVVQETPTLVTSLLPTLAEPLVTVQLWLGLVGCVRTVTLYVEPASMGVLKVNGPLAETIRSLPPLFRSTRPVPESPLTVPPIVWVLVTQLTAILVTFAPATVPEPLVTVQLWLGLVGCVRTVTL